MILKVRAAAYVVFFLCLTGKNLVVIVPSVCEQNGHSEALGECHRHANQALKYYCRDCTELVCRLCISRDIHPQTHKYDTMSSVMSDITNKVQRLVESCRVAQGDYKNFDADLKSELERLKSEYCKASAEVEQTRYLFQAAINYQAELANVRLQELYNSRHKSLSETQQNLYEKVACVNNGQSFLEKFRSLNVWNEDHLRQQGVVLGILENHLNYRPGVELHPGPLVYFKRHEVSIHTAIQHAFGSVGTSIRMQNTAPWEEHETGLGCSAAYAKPNLPLVEYSRSTLGAGIQSLYSGQQFLRERTFPEGNSFPDVLTNGNRFNETDCNSSTGTLVSNKPQSSDGLLETLVEVGHDSNWLPNPQSRKNSTGSQQSKNSVQVMTTHHTNGAGRTAGSGNQPPKCNLSRGQMIYSDKFGEFGEEKTQFTEPSGVATSTNGDIIVADTNNHRIQVFNASGQFKFCFGEAGKREQQLLYPNRVAVSPKRGEIVITERSPTHQVQVYSPSGEFIRRFASDLLENPRGICIDNHENVIVVECKVMRVSIFTLTGRMVHRFTGSLQFPNGCATNDREIFVSDNRGHCVSVFSYQGEFVRVIGGEGITNYPIGVGITPNGLVLVADNHNNFNVTLFTQQGQLVAGLESRVKHAQCYDVALLGDNQIVLSSKDYRIYIYTYAAYGMNQVDDGNIGMQHFHNSTAFPAKV